MPIFSAQRFLHEKLTLIIGSGSHARAQSLRFRSQSTINPQAPPGFPVDLGFNRITGPDRRKINEEDNAKI